MKYKVRVRIGVSNRPGRRVSQSPSVSVRAVAGSWSVAASQAPSRDVAAASEVILRFSGRRGVRRGSAAGCLCGGRCLYG